MLLLLLLICWILFWSWTRKWQREHFGSIKAMLWLLYATFFVKLFSFYSPYLYVRDLVLLVSWRTEVGVFLLKQFCGIPVCILKNNRTYNCVFCFCDAPYKWQKCCSSWLLALSDKNYFCKSYKSLACENDCRNLEWGFESYKGGDFIPYNC